MTPEYRELTLDDYEQAAQVESRAFYNRPSDEMTDRMRALFPPEWTIGAFVDGRLVADVRTVPQVRRMHGATMGFGAVGPVTCAAPYRRQGHVGRLLTLSLERMRDRGQVLSGLFTPHDALYQRFGWERAEFKKRYTFRPKDIRLRLRSSGGRTLPAGPEDWERLAPMYKEKTVSRNGPFVRSDVWWKEGVLRHWDGGKRLDSDAVIWVDADGRDRGYVVYFDRAAGDDGRGHERREIFIRDFIALSPDAYLGLWEHMLTHDLADRIITETHPDDIFPQLCEDPFRIDQSKAEGGMLRVVDVERALSQRPSVATRASGFTARIEDHNLPWNDGAWRIEAAEGRASAERTEGQADVEMSVNALASLFTGYVKPEAAAEAGFIRLNTPEALGEMTQVFAVSDPPYCHDWY